ncbi:MAG: hypothetical protein JWQ94_2983 [Tardiphaga sp.]|nr:hypothetical protein [Tardiphaga sp.]
MATEMRWDQAFLKQRADDEQQLAFAQQTDLDWQQARAQVRRELSDQSMEYTSCTRACRRARRCIEEPPVCDVAALPRAVERPLIEEAYAAIQIERQQAAEQEQTAERRR